MAERGADGLHVVGAGLDTGRYAAGGHPREAAVALVHDTVAGKGRQQLAVEAHAGLALGDVPGTDGPALGPAQADGIVDAHGAVVFDGGRAPGAQLGTGRMRAVHAAPGDIERQVPAVLFDRGRLDVEPVVRREPVVHVPGCGEILRLDLGRIHFGEGFFRLGIVGLMGLVTGIHAGAAAFALGQIEQGGERFVGRLGVPGPQPFGRPRRGQGRAGRSQRQQKFSSVHRSFSQKGLYESPGHGLPRLPPPAH